LGLSSFVNEILGKENNRVKKVIAIVAVLVALACGLVACAPAPVETPVAEPTAVVETYEVPVPTDYVAPETATN
jgi:hypothetical protein